MKEKNEDIRKRILIPVALALLMVLGFSLSSLSWLQHRKMDEGIVNELEKLHELFPKFLQSEASLIKSIISPIEKDVKVQKAWIAENRKELFRLAEPIYQDLFVTNNITHFYFIDNDRKCFLRVHNEKRHGDIINRYTMKQAVQRRNSVSGIELGPYGTFTLRIVYPWYINGKIVGYIELGKEIDRIVSEMRSILHTELIVVIKKRYLNRQRWEEGLKMMGHKGFWGQLRNHVVAYQSFEGMPPELELLLEKSSQAPTGSVFISEMFGNPYRVGFFHLIDAGSNYVGDIIVLNDVTEDRLWAERSLNLQIGLCGIISVILFSFFYSYIGRIQTKLVKGRNDLLSEIKERKLAEQELKEHSDRLEELVQERTVSLTKSNVHLQYEIREHERTQEKLKHLNEKLEQLVEEKTKELLYARESLFQKEKLAVLGKLAGSVGQEILNPLGVISNACYFLKMKSADIHDPTITDNINMIKKETEVAVKIISDILDYSLVNHPVHQHVDVNMLMKNVLSGINVRERNSVTTNLSPGITPSSLDPVQMGKVFENLIENAFQAMEDGGALSIKTRQAKGTTEIIFSDKGCGIPEDDLEKIFDPLFTNKNKNIGLGLAVCKSLTEANGGTILVESAEGEGSTFIVRFSN